ncbi:MULTISPECIES: hypothetical protein [unclassified Butyrivibrio]|uniref:hypothetical protein n=1 Tax=unclassified Butyrivibrio TaxID=2639466 RepID=UPI0003F52F34|nr:MULTISPECIES: hypothetical protein [unclassified Butyrivibrio]
MIKEHISKIQRGECSKTEIVLTGICLVLAGIVLGMKFAPFRVTTLGSFNGNTGCIGKPENLKKLLKEDDAMER